MENQKTIISLETGAGFQLIDSKFNVALFEAQLKELKEKESKLLSSLVKYVAELGATWNEDEARNNLTQYLMKNGAAYNLFIRQYSHDETSDNSIPATFYIQKYIEFLLGRRGDVIFDYLMDIVGGLMVYVGVYYTEDYPSTKDDSFAGTRFYLDTKLLLRFLGYSMIVHIEAAQELVREIQSKQGTIYVFDHNVKEVENALVFASERMRHNVPIKDDELRMFCKARNFKPDDLMVRMRGIKDTIEKEHKFTIAPTVNTEDVRNIRHNNIWDELYKHIHTRYKWRPGTIENDVASIRCINVLRNGDYSIRFGGQRKLPIFVTTNYLLVKAIREYLVQAEKDGDEKFVLSAKNLPIISDTLLMCRLWLPNASKNEEIPLLTFAGSVATIQQGDMKFYQQFRSEAKDVKTKFQGTAVDLVEERAVALEDYLNIELSDEEANLEPELYASNIEELIELEKTAANIEKERLNNDLAERDQQLDAIKEKVIFLSVTQSVRKISNWIPSKILAIISKYWWVICAIAVFIVTAMFHYLFAGHLFTSQFPFTFIPPAIFCVLKIIDKVLPRKNISSSIEKRCFNAISTRFSKYIARQHDMDNCDEIISRCINHFVKDPSSNEPNI